MRIKRNFAASLAALLVVCGFVSLAVGFRFAHLQACANSMRIIASAKGSHGLESKLSPGERVVPEMISPFLKDGWHALRCPSGGQYEPGLFTGDKENGDVQHAPACSVHGSLASLESSSRDFFAVARPYFVVSIACMMLAVCFVLACLVDGRKSRSQQCAPPKGGPVTQFGISRVSKGPPSLTFGVGDEH